MKGKFKLNMALFLSQALLLLVITSQVATANVETKLISEEEVKGGGYPQEISFYPSVELSLEEQKANYINEIGKNNALKGVSESLIADIKKAISDAKTQEELDKATNLFYTFAYGNGQYMIEEIERSVKDEAKKAELKGQYEKIMSIVDAEAFINAYSLTIDPIWMINDLEADYNQAFTDEQKSSLLERLKKVSSVEELEMIQAEIYAIQDVYYIKQEASYTAMPQEKFAYYVGRFDELLAAKNYTDLREVLTKYYQEVEIYYFLKDLNYSGLTAERVAYFKAEIQAVIDQNKSYETFSSLRDQFYMETQIVELTHNIKTITDEEVKADFLNQLEAADTDEKIYELVDAYWQYVEMERYMNMGEIERKAELSYLKDEVKFRLGSGSLYDELIAMLEDEAYLTGEKNLYELSRTIYNKLDEDLALVADDSYEADVYWLKYDIRRLVDDVNDQEKYFAMLKNVSNLSNTEFYELMENVRKELESYNFGQLFGPEALAELKYYMDAVDALPDGELKYGLQGYIWQAKDYASYILDAMDGLRENLPQDKVMPAEEVAFTKLKEQGVVQGYSDGTFGGDKVINKAEAVKILVKAFGLIGDNGMPKFADVAPDAWYAEFLGAAVANGLLDAPTEGSKFDAGAALTGEEAVKMLAAASKESPTGLFAKELSSQKEVTRGMFATFVYLLSGK